MRGAFVAFALTLSGVASADEQMSDVEAKAVQLALNRGQLLYAYDQAAWHATDAMMATSKAAGLYDRIMSTGGGYVVEGDARGPVVSFYDRSEPPRVFFRARMVEGGTAVASGEMLNPPENLTYEQRLLVAARDTVLKAASAAKLEICAQASPNVTILPRDSDRGSVAYLMTPQTMEKTFPVGGHYRFDLRAGRIENIKPFTKSCVELGPRPSDSGTPAAMMVTHLLDTTPTEIHVFTALNSRIPLFVLTTLNKKTWAVEATDGRAQLRLVDQDITRLRTNIK